MMSPEDREILKVRLRFVDLVKSFFIGEPDAERMSRWRGTFSALTKEKINPDFDRSVADIHKLLSTKSLQDLQEEYYQLFTDPFSEDQINTAASFYFDGRSYGQTLVELRSFVADVNLEKEAAVTETEDSLVVMLDILTRLIEEEKQSGDQKTRDQQGQLLQKFLLPFSKSLSEACDSKPTAEFYKACCSFFGGYLQLEKAVLALSE